MPSFFRSQNFLESSVEFAYLSFLKDMLWLLYRFLKSPSTRPMYLKFSSLSQLRFAWYMRLFVRQLLSNVEALTFITKLKLDNRVQAYFTNESFVTIKDHKENFYTNPQCRLINPAKTQMGRISKKMLENIVDEIKIQSELNLWKNDQSVLSWFSTIEKNKSSKFIQFDIESFYPSITKELLGRALDYAQSIVDIDQTKLDIIQHSRKSLLFSGSECWIKKNDELFDVTMGAFDGAEVCELVGLYLLKKIKNIIPPSHVDCRPLP